MFFILLLYTCTCVVSVLCLYVFYMWTGTPTTRRPRTTKPPPTTTTTGNMFVHLLPI